MKNPDNIHTGIPRFKSIYPFEKVLEIAGSTTAERNAIINACHNLYEETKEEITYIEIGIWLGATFKEILTETKDIKLTGIGVDLFEDFKIINDISKPSLGNTHHGDVAKKSDVEKKLNNLGITNFKLLKGDTLDVINTFSPMKNVVCFIDANHTYEGVKNDFNAMLPKIKNGYVIFDDMDWTTIKEFFEEIRSHYPIEYEDNRCVVIKIN